MPPQLTTCSNLHAVFLEAIDDRQRAERRRLDERAVNFRRRRVKRLAEEQAGEPLIHEDGAIAVVPIQREQAGFAGLQFQRARRSGFMRAIACDTAFGPPGWM